MNCKDVAGTKFDQDKNRLELIPAEMIEEVGKVLTYGAKKYGDYNWMNGMKWSRLYGATLRHLIAWWQGYDDDKETGSSHLIHAICCLTFLFMYKEYNIGDDDRP